MESKFKEGQRVTVYDGDLQGFVNATLVKRIDIIEEGITERWQMITENGYTLTRIVKDVQIPLLDGSATIAKDNEDNEDNYLLSYCDNCLHDKVLQDDLRNKAKSLLIGVLSNKSDYAKEKCIKSFSESIRNFELFQLYKNGVHPNQYDFKSMSFIKTYDKKIEEIRKLVLAEISRTFRHYTIFL